MSESLQALSAAFEAVRAGGNLTITTGQTGVPALDGFLATLPTRSLELQQAQIVLNDKQSPATLVVSGQLPGSWPVPGLAASLTTQTATIRYAQDDAGAPVTASLAVTATLPVGGQSLSLAGSLAAGASMTFQAVHGQQAGGLSLGDAVSLTAANLTAVAVPAAVPLFDRLQLSSCTLSFGFSPGTPTILQFSLDAEPGATWEIVPGQHVLEQVGVGFVARRGFARSGPGFSYGGNVHATLNLGRPFQVTVGLAPGHVWNVDVAADKGLPTLADLAALAGAGTEVQTGLQAVGLGDITVTSVSLGIDRAARTLSYLSMRGTLPLAGVVIDVYVLLPDFQFGGALSDQTPMNLTELLGHFLDGTGGLPDVTLEALSLSATPEAGSYAITATLADNAITAGGTGYPADQIGNFFQGLGGDFAGFGQSVLNTLNPTNWFP